MRKIFCALLSVILLMGCSFSKNIPTNIPTGSEPEQRPSETETSSTTESIAEENYLRYSPYIVGDSARQQLGEEYALYCRMIDAVVSYDGCVSGFESEQQFVRIWGILLNEFIPARKLVQTYKHTDTPYTYHEGTVQLTFLCDRNTHNKYLAEFESKINEVLSMVQADDSDVEVIAKLYEYVSCNMIYANGYKTLYDRIMNETGVCGAYARYLEFLLNHAGIECQEANGYDSETGGHAWVIAKIDGQWYHFDPTWEASELFPRWYWFGVGDNLRHNSLVGEWIQGIIGGVGNLEMDKSGLLLFGERDYLSGKDFASPQCPSDFKPNTRQDGLRPEFW